MPHIVLVEPEIPPNTGNIIRLAANTGFHLHLIKPLGFTLNDARMRRAGLDYHEFAHMQTHDSLHDFLIKLQPETVWAFSSKAQKRYDTVKFNMNDALVFGPETRGLNQQHLSLFPVEQRLRLPMLAKSRSLNLSNTVAIVVYEAWKQCGFEGAVDLNITSNN